MSVKNPYVSLLSTSWANANQRQRVMFVFLYVLNFVTNALSALFPLLYGWFVDSLQKNMEQALSNVWWYAAGYIGLTLLYWLFHGPARLIERKLAFQISSNFLDDLVSKLLHTEVGWHKKNHSGATVNRLRKAYIGLRSFFDNGFLYVQTFVQLLVSMIAMIYFSPVFGAVAVVLGLCSIWVNFKLDKPFIKALDGFNEEEHETTASISDSLSNVLTVITLRLENRIATDIRQKIKKMFPAFRRITIIAAYKWFTANILSGLIFVVIVVGYVYSNYTPANALQIGALVALIGFVTQFTTSFNGVVAQYTNIVQFYAEVNAVDTIRQQPAVKEQLSAAQGLADNWQKLAVSNLSFTYGNETQTAADRANLIDDVTLHLEKGRHMALTGKSGAGKSTLLSLLRGLYQPLGTPAVQVDDMRGGDLSQIAQSSVLFPQDPEIFENTVTFNLTIGLSFDPQEIRRACELACVDDVIDSLPEGLDTVINEKGGNLSGGQKQRLAIARGILASKDRDILLLDEPTSSSDEATQRKIYQNIINEYPDKVVLSTVHNRSLLDIFDDCILFEDGAVKRLQPDSSLTEKIN